MSRKLEAVLLFQQAQNGIAKKIPHSLSNDFSVIGPADAAKRINGDLTAGKSRCRKINKRQIL
ncbi:hypothetical protein Pr1d_33040 [Bythopirellula goksoeyrii]|uniref:Uncharacterized protein n=1 Tax=Bythopirellula goksoeyrii TaxID=1400387 RepID=A0A5B9QEH6_9BACT|nr:hypothetical protein Pr1d_33040 [Bythopirellula goksoeyrii]